VIVEQRTYTIQTGKMNVYKDFFAEHGLPVQQRVLGNLLGFFVSDIGELNQVIQLWGFDSYEDRVRRRAELFSTPEWLDYLKNAPPVILRQENSILAPTAFSPIR
jgi:hypothetical protein